ncbi:hypothetical protein [Carboxydothermus pertinax]|uniref:Uncharacterized protein n=1 Tax=Carboxydothermus pertinax TaxID=870242 RepID=A0A1L8CWK3_9THEO|nr:hypothetical protein [Carboxydothermus pertinax]GAV23298.1 hypothetical protein cpu_18080 [Carboxydothermus pertinax]
MSVDQAKIEARLDQITNMLTELIRIVGNNNAAIEELRSDMKELRQDVDVLKSDVAELKSDVATLKKDMQEVKETLKEHTEKLDYALFKLANHDADIFNLKRIKP